jgi:hypothetical protein
MACNAEFGGAQGEAVGNGGELVAAANAVFAETGLEDAADGGDEGAAAGEEDAVDFAGMDAGSLSSVSIEPRWICRSSDIQDSNSARVTGMRRSMLAWLACRESGTRRGRCGTART